MIELIGAEVAPAATFDPPDGCRIDLRRKLGRLHRKRLQRRGELQQQLGDISTVPELNESPRGPYSFLSACIS